MTDTPAKETPDFYFWMATLFNPNLGHEERVPLCATLEGQPPTPLGATDLGTVMGLKPIAQQAADALDAVVTLYSFRGEQKMEQLQPNQVRPASMLLTDHQIHKYRSKH